MHKHVTRAQTLEVAARRALQKLSLPGRAESSRLEATRELEVALLPRTSDPALFVNDGRTVLVRSWASGLVEVAFRESTAHIWGAPIVVAEELPV